MMDDFLHESDEARENIVEKSEITQLEQQETEVCIRRSDCFKDYMDVRIKKRFKPEAVLMITFSGQPAIDGGGPRREFFSGEIFYKDANRKVANEVVFLSNCWKSAKDLAYPAKSS